MMAALALTAGTNTCTAIAHTVQQNAATMSVNIRLMPCRAKCWQTSASSSPPTAATGTSASVPPNRYANPAAPTMQASTSSRRVMRGTVRAACNFCSASMTPRRPSANSRESSFTASTRPKWIETVGTCRTSDTASLPGRCADAKTPFVST